MNNIKTFGWFRRVALAEGVSFLVLLLIAMPLKYFANMPKAVNVVGMLHGLLFITFVILAFAAKNSYRKSFAWFVKSFLASLIPFGTFIADRQWKKEEIETINS